MQINTWAQFILKKTRNSLKYKNYQQILLIIQGELQVIGYEDMATRTGDHDSTPRCASMTTVDVVNPKEHYDDGQARYCRNAFFTATIFLNFF